MNCYAPQLATALHCHIKGRGEDFHKPIELNFFQLLRLRCILLWFLSVSRSTLSIHRHLGTERNLPLLLCQPVSSNTKSGTRSPILDRIFIITLVLALFLRFQSEVARLSRMACPFRSLYAPFRVEIVQPAQSASSTIAHGKSGWVGSKITWFGWPAPCSNPKLHAPRNAARARPKLIIERNMFRSPIVLGLAC